MESRGTPDLLCEENMDSFLTEKNEDHASCSVSESDCEYVETMFGKETPFQPGADVNSDWTQRWWFVSVRSNIIKWILQKRAEFGYRYRTAYIALVYFDRFLTRIEISEGKLLKLQLLSIACFSVAAKMEESEARPLSDYTREEGYNFENISINRMELIVLDTLEWTMCCVTPFTFLTYFAAKFCEERTDHQELILQANHLILSIIKEIDVAKHRPSIIAAAAVLAAHDMHLSEAGLGSKMDAVPPWGAVEKESTIKCYRLLQEIMEVKTPKSTVSQNLLDNDNEVAVDEPTSTRRGARRRLDFDNQDNQDQDFPPRKNSKE